jgi:hypothetical protein
MRFAVVVIFFAVAAVTYILVSVLVPQEGFINILSLIAALAVAAGTTQLVDRLLRKRWPSGRTLQIKGDMVQLVLRDNVQKAVDGGQHVNVLLWYFEIKRRSRVPKGWYVIAMALMQDDEYVPVYTFASPDDFRMLPLHDHFTKLTAKKDRDKGDQDMRLAGKERRLQTAETARWIEGAEMNRDDFTAFVKRLQQQFPAWMPE